MNPVFIDGENYNGTPNMTKHPLLKKYLKEHFVKEIEKVSDAIIIPLGSKVSDVIKTLTDSGLINDVNVLDGIPHPSPASAERIAYFLERKDKSMLSKKTNPKIIDAGKNKFIKKLASLTPTKQ